jgi:hypothetical protein
MFVMWYDVLYTLVNELSFPYSQLTVYVILSYRLSIIFLHYLKETYTVTYGFSFFKIKNLCNMIPNFVEEHCHLEDISKGS